MKKNSAKTQQAQGSSKIIYLDQIRWRKAGQLLRRKLGEFADRAAFFDEAAEAQEIYLNSIASGYGDREDDFTMERCFEWFIFDYVLSGGRTLIEDFKESQTFSEMENQLLADWSAARISVYEVIHVISGKCMVIRDIIHRNEFIVQDPSVADLVEIGTVLLMRVLKVGDEYEFSTSGLALPGFCKLPLVKKIQDDFAKYHRRKGIPHQEAWPLYLRERAHKINGWVMDIGINASASMPSQVDTGKAPSRTVIRNIWDKRIKDQPSTGVDQKITYAFLEDFYGKWIDQRTPSLGNKTPREACRSNEGRGRVEELLRELELVEVNRARNGEPHYDLEKVREQLNLPGKVPDFAWIKPAHGRVAGAVSEYLGKMGYDRKQVAGAIRLWQDYCRLVNPKLRKESVWAATVAYAVDRMEFSGIISQQELARSFGVSASTVSGNFRAICDALGLMAYDRRYSTRKSPLEGLVESNPFLASILENFKL